MEHGTDNLLIMRGSFPPYFMFLLLSSQSTSSAVFTSSYLFLPFKTCPISTRPSDDGAYLSQPNDRGSLKETPCFAFHIKAKARLPCNGNKRASLAGGRWLVSLQCSFLLVQIRKRETIWPEILSLQKLSKNSINLRDRGMLSSVVLESVDRSYAAQTNYRS